MGLPTPFPSGALKATANPAIRLFGLRFFKDQTILEYLAEFLAVVFSPKRISGSEVIGTPLPTLETLHSWTASADSAPLHYRPPVRLNLKLLAFLSLSPIDKRHDIHLRHYEELANRLASSLQTVNLDRNEVAVSIEDLIQGYQGAGFSRTWCAQTFYPVSAGLLTQETIWNESVARRKKVQTWEESTADFGTYYRTDGNVFLARGGEVLYLQLCNVLSVAQATVDEFVHQAGISVTNDEADLGRLHESLATGFGHIYGAHTAGLDSILDHVDGLDGSTLSAVDKSVGELTCGWCPRESWPEAFLFAIELRRLMSAVLDPVDRLELLTTGCALQVLRSLCAQSIRYSDGTLPAGGGCLGYSWIVSSSDHSTRQQQLASQRNLQVVQGIIQRALRNAALVQHVQHSVGDDALEARRSYAEADARYGHKLLVALGKRLGIIIPWRGPGARFIMTERMLRYMVMTLLRPGERQTYDEFLARLYCHFGIAIEGSQLDDAMVWSGLPANASVQHRQGSWLSSMLRAGGFLTELSDACSIVHNPFFGNTD